MSEFRYLEKEERVGKIVVSASGLVTLDESPKHFHSKYILKEDQDDDTEAKEDGKLVHLSVLEPQRFKETCIVLDAKDGYLETVDDLKTRIKSHGQEPKGKKKADFILQLLTIEPDAKIWDTYEANMRASGKQLVSAKDYKKCTRIIEEISKHDWLAKLPQEKSNEVPGYFVHKSGVIISFRLDSFFVGTHKETGAQIPMVLDLKKTRNASPRKFQTAMEEYKMIMLAAIYVDAVNAILKRDDTRFCWIAVEEKPPYCLETYIAEDEDIVLGRYAYEAMIEKLLWCHKENKWPGYTNGKLNKLGLSEFARKRIEDRYAEVYQSTQ